MVHRINPTNELNAKLKPMLKATNSVYLSCLLGNMSLVKAYPGINSIKAPPTTTLKADHCCSTI